MNFIVDVKVHHPWIFYIYDNNEIWMHRLDKPTEIHRYVMINTIGAIDYLDDVYFQKGVSRPPCSFMCLLTYKNVHKLAEFKFREYPEISKSGELKEGYIKDMEDMQVTTYVMDRFQENITDNNVTGQIFSFYVLRISKVQDYYIMMHYLNRVEFYDSRSERIEFTIEKRLNQRNIIKFDQNTSDKDSDSHVFFWEDNGRFIERLQMPESGRNDFKVFNAYNSVNRIKLCKKIYFEKKSEVKKALLVSDDQNIVKILVYNPIDKRFDFEREYFVSDNFGLKSDFDLLETYNLVNGILYCNDKSYLLKNKSANAKEFAIHQTSCNYDRNLSSFPLCSENYILRKIAPQKVDKEKGKKDKVDKGTYLHLTPPLNSNKIMLSIESYTDIEFFVHSDNSMFIRVEQDFEEGLAVIQLYNFSNVFPLHEIEWNLKEEGVILDQHLDMNGEQSSGKSRPKPFQIQVSQDGRYLCAISENKDEVKYQILSLHVSESDKSTTGEDEQQLDKKTNHSHKINTNKMLPLSFGIERMNRGQSKQKPLFTKHKWKITNKGDVIGVDLFGRKLYINQHDHFAAADRCISQAVPFKIFKKRQRVVYRDSPNNTIIGEDYIVTWTESGLYSFRFNTERNMLDKFQKILHDPILDIEDITLTQLAPTSHNDFFLIVYKFESSENIMIWDLENNEEYDNFQTRESDKFKFYCNGVKRIKQEDEQAQQNEDEQKEEKWEFSEKGYLMFDHYYVNIDDMVPSPFIQARSRTLDPFYWNMGMRMSTDEKYVLIKNKLIKSYSFLGLYLRAKLEYTAPKSVEYCKYFIDRSSIISDFDSDLHELEKILELISSNPAMTIYFTAILLPDATGESPMVRAIERNAPKTVELFLKYLSLLPEFKLSKTFKNGFDKLFRMGMNEYKTYLESCFFQTGQMVMIDQVYSKPIEETKLESSNSSMLGDKFLKFLPKMSEKEKEKNKAKSVEKDEVNEFNLEDSSTPAASMDLAEEESVLDVGEVHIDIQDEEKADIKDHTTNTVTVKAIDFDWILKTEAGENFLQHLADTEDLSYFDIDIVKHIIAYQWRRYLPVIFLFLFLPFLIFFAIFLVFATSLINQRQIEEDSSGYWHVVSAVFGIILAVFQVFFVGVELNQIMKAPKNYFTSFWNVIDIASISLNYALILMMFLGADADDTNAVAGVAVLLLWVRVFYLLRVFPDTAYLVSMITYIILDMRFFLLALFLAVCAFANAYYILGRNSEEDNFSGDNAWQAFIYSYRTGYGDFDVEGFGTRDEILIWIIWFINTIIIAIILLNLVIAIMGDTFGRVQETQEATKLKEYASIMRESEFLFTRSSFFRKTKYIIVIEPNKSDEDDQGDWQGKLIELKKKLNSCVSKNKTILKNFQKRMAKSIDNDLREKLKPTEDRLNQVVDTFGTKIAKGLESSLGGTNPEYMLHRLQAANQRPI